MLWYHRFVWLLFLPFFFLFRKVEKKGKGKKEFTRKWDGRYVIGWFILLVHVGVFL